MGLGGVQKAKTRQIDASEIIGKAGSSEQEAPNHPQSSSKLIKYIYNIYQTYILYIFIYIYVYVDFWDDHGTFQKYFFSEIELFWSFLMGYQLTTGDIDPNTLEIMFYHFFTSNSSIV